MRVIAISHLKAFWEQCPDAEQSLLAWIDEAKNVGADGKLTHPAD